eukprot:NODE_10065_length_1379_cov_3.404952.p1 GENE.NODE_10065_length_1379_cov_3.404952~~NODE_10065_length_1379_cov_3.404952.p1  ORF type:complete len:374 (+),score=62.58 NODE_10065_length_1379_cov_3.404952:103-1224(+)
MAKATRVLGLVALLSSTSTALSVSSGQEPVVATPTGHTLYSTDPAASVRFIDKFLAKFFTVLAKDAGATHTVVVGGSELRFVRATHAGTTRAIEAATGVWEQIVNPDSPLNYSEWVDYHVGIRQDGVGRTAWMEQLNASDDAYWFSYAAVLRLYIPGTIFSLEFTVDVGDAHPAHLEWYGDACRDNEPEDQAGHENRTTGWKKNTYASTNATATMELMIRLFDASQYSDPFPWPPREGCEAARWVRLPNSTVVFHIVESQHAYPVDPDFNVSSYIASLHDANDASITVLLSNKLDFPGNTADVDIENPSQLLRRLESGGYDYSARNEEEGCAIYTELISTGFYIRAVHRGYDCSPSLLVRAGVDQAPEDMCSA